MKIGSAVRPGRVPEKKRTRQDSQKKSQGGNISPIWGEAPTVPIKTKICMVGSLSDVIIYAKFQVEIFVGVTILQGVEFPIFLLIFEWALQQCSATALPVIITYWRNAYGVGITSRSYDYVPAVLCPCRLKGYGYIHAIDCVMCRFPPSSPS